MICSSTDNSFIETFNGSFRDECLNLHWFESLAEAKRETEAWRRDYNEMRPYTALKDLTPGEFARQYSLRPKAHEKPNTNARRCPRNSSGSQS
ncbi:Mobile element protein [Burkholderia singularis]|uniref:Mobile element protein n=1 Tax=Burkholderia singularis TaxID=1503053 RepID=A0A238H5R3_9BURK|nr:Mobile element protein [Burkholderia singularis]